LASSAILVDGIGKSNNLYALVILVMASVYFCFETRSIASNIKAGYPSAANILMSFGVFIFLIPLQKMLT